jgi:hypothetical protein
MKEVNDKEMKIKEDIIEKQERNMKLLTIENNKLRERI